MSQYGEFVKVLLNKLVGFKTVNPPGMELEAAEYLKTFLVDMGVEATVQRVAENRGNVIGRLRGKNSGKTLMLNGHLDVVSASPSWSIPPFVAIEKNGRIYGRGTSDMKGGIAAQITAVKKIMDDNIQLNGDILLFYDADEEVSSIGAEHFLKDCGEIDFAVVGEPTELNINIAHRGVIRYLVTIIGKGGHASEPDLAVNSLVKAAAFVEAVTGIDKKLRQRSHDILPSPTMTVTMISGGGKGNVIPSECKIKIDRRTLPGETPQSAMKELLEVLDGMHAADEGFDYTIEPYIFTPAGEVDKSSSVVEGAKRAYLKCFGENPDIGYFVACCEQAFFTKKNIDTIVFGPGSIKQAHTDDEFIEISQLNDAVDFYYELVLELLK